MTIITLLGIILVMFGGLIGNYLFGIPVMQLPSVITGSNAFPILLAYVLTQPVQFLGIVLLTITCMVWIKQYNRGRG